MRPIRLFASLFALAGVGCAAQPGREAPVDNFVIEPDDASDMVKQTKIIDSIALNSRIDGRFDRRTRVYGFTFEAKAGATIGVQFTTRPGSDSGSTASTLDTVLAVYGPMVGNDRGPLLQRVDDDGENVAAQLAALPIRTDGKYLVVMSTWDDPGTNGTYRVDVSCTGTDFQCRRPVQNLPCTPGTRYIQGGSIIGTETWDTCEVVLLESTRVAADAVLTVRPGVTVKGNFLGTGDYGVVDLVVEGQIQAVGTATAPVLFTSLRNGWKGIVLRGASSTLENVFVENAATGIEIRGAQTVLNRVNVNSGNVGVRVDGSVRNVANGLVIRAVRQNGIVIHNGQIEINDATIKGMGVSTSAGVLGTMSPETSKFYRAFVEGFDTGLSLTATMLEVYDSTIVNNNRGVYVSGPNSGVTYAFDACPPAPMSPPAQPRPAIPTTWGRDPVFIRCDIVNNRGAAVTIDAPELLVIEDSNIRGNHAGVVVAANSLHPESRIIRSNVAFNAPPMSSGVPVQVDAYHTNGTLDISGNYWGYFSDPELAMTRRTTHSQQRTCTIPATNGLSCSWVGNNLHCGSYVCANGNPPCNGPTQTATIQSMVRFTGFSPVALNAGPRIQDLSMEVKEARGMSGL